MARRGRKPKAVKPKEFVFSNDKDYNTHHTAGSKGMLFSSAGKFMNLFPQGKKDFYMTPVKKGERLGYGKYRIEAHHPNKHSDDRDAYEAKREKDVIYKNALTKPSRIKYDGITHNAGYHLVTHDRDGKRVEFWLKPYKVGGATVMAEMYLPDLQRRKAKKGKDGTKLMSCAVEVGKINASASKKGQLKFEKVKPKGECAKYGNSNAKYGKPLSPIEYEAESQETFLSEDDMIYFYAMTGQEMDLSDYQAIDSVEVDRTSYQPTQDYGAESEAATYSPSSDPDMTNAIQTEPTNENPVLFAEGDAATYSPSSDPDMVNSIQTEPTNAEADLFGSQGYNDRMDESMGMRNGRESTMEQSMKDRRDEASAMDRGHSSMHRKYDDVMNMDAEAKNRWVKGKNGKTYVMRKKTGRMVTHNAESPGGAYPTLEDFNGLESVVVEPPMGHGVAQWYAEGSEGFTDIDYDAKIRLKNPKDSRYITPSIEDGMDFENGEGVLSSKSKIDMNAEGDSATYTPSDEPDMVNEIQTEPTNANADLFGSETLAEIEGPTAEATAGGLHSPSSFDISWEDGNGLSSASMPPNEIAWAENKETYCAGCKAAESGCHCAEVYGADNLADYKPIDSVEVDATSYQPTQDYGSEFEGEFTDDMKKGAAYGMGGYAGFVGFGLIASSVVLALELIGRKMGE